MDFRWNHWNRDHLGEHGVDPAEAARVVLLARRPFPRQIGEDKYIVWGHGSGGRMLQVIYLVEDDGTFFIIHARPLTETEKRRWRRIFR